MSGPRAVLLIKVDTLGDLVLFAPVLQALRAAWPQTRIAAVIRRSYVDLAPLLAPGIEWVPTTLDPFAQGPAADSAELTRLREIVAALQPEVIAAATSRRNWLEIVLAASAPAARRLALGTGAGDMFFDTQLRVDLGIDSAAAFSETVSTSTAGPDWQQNYRLADALLGRAVDRTPPALTVPDAARATAATFLVAKKLAPRSFVVCAAAGFTNVRLKTWPADRFAAAIAHLRDRHGLPALLIGHESEREYLEKIPGAAALWLGRDGDLPLLSALIAQSALFFGNDTGAMHLAAALDVPVVAIFGGGTWPRFVPAARRGVALVHPLPCFGCGWDCAFGDAPCLGEITVADATTALDRALTATTMETVQVQHIGAEAQALMGKAAARYHESRTGHLARQHKLEELKALATEKDSEISALKTVCDEREKTIFILDGHVRNLQADNATVKAANAVHEKTLAAMPADAAKAAKTIADLVVHNRNIESLLKHREAELAELKLSIANHTAGWHEVEHAKHYGKLLSEKETTIQALSRGLADREEVIKRLAAESTGLTGALRKLWIGSCAHVRLKWWQPFDAWLFKRVVEDYWMQIGILSHYAPRPIAWDRLPNRTIPEASLPRIGVVTPSYGQEKFVERTLRSVLDQSYAKLLYAVQDGGSRDRSPQIIAGYAARLRHWESVKDNGQADAIGRGFRHIAPALAPNDAMAWLNSDDLLAPGALRFVAEYFATHPDVDVLYGHRIIIDDDDRDVGRWIMPRHNAGTLEWIDYVPQETLFWRKRAWDRVGGIDPSFHFALDWDLLARFQQAGCRMVRVPYFLGAFRVHAEQKTSQAIHTTGADEMRRIRTRFHGERQDDFETINRHAREARFWGAITARLHAIGIRW